MSSQIPTIPTIKFATNSSSGYLVSAFLVTKKGTNENSNPVTARVVTPGGLKVPLCNFPVTGEQLNTYASEHGNQVVTEETFVAGLGLKENVLHYFVPRGDAISNPYNVSDGTKTGTGITGIYIVCRIEYNLGGTAIYYIIFDIPREQFQGVTCVEIEGSNAGFTCYLLTPTSNRDNCEKITAVLAPKFKERSDALVREKKTKKKLISSIFEKYFLGESIAFIKENIEACLPTFRDGIKDTICAKMSDDELVELVELIESEI